MRYTRVSTFVEVQQHGVLRQCHAHQPGPVAVAKLLAEGGGHAIQQRHRTIHALDSKAVMQATAVVKASCSYERQLVVAVFIMPCKA